MELVFIFSVVLMEIRLVNFPEVMKVIGTVRVYTFMDDKVLAVFLWNKCIAAMGTAQLNTGEAAFGRRKPRSTDLAEELTFRAIVFVKEWFWSIAAGAGAVVRDVTLGTTANGAYFFAIAFFVVRDKLFISPVLTEVSDEREFIDFELLVFGGMRIIKSPLFEGDVSADEVEQPAVLLVKVLNKL